MSYNGFEIDMLTVGNADCILTSRWTDDVCTRVLIDGANASNATQVRRFLNQLGIAHIDHVVCSHPHADHVGGFLMLLSDRSLSFGRLWMHQPWNHIDTSLLFRAWNQSQSRARKITKSLTESFGILSNLAEIASARCVPVADPFTGMHIGPLLVCGPREEFYCNLLLEFADMDKLAALETSLEERLRQRQIADAVFETTGVDPYAGLLDEPQTDPENNAATILCARFNDKTFVMTSDAGVPALRRAQQAYQIGTCHWMQIPHHGSRRNMTQELIDYFCPAVAYVSASGSRKHPRLAVVNAFKKCGTQVFSTHYPSSTNMWYHIGDVPPRPEYRSLTAL